MAIGRSEAGRKNRQNILDYMHKMGRPVAVRAPLEFGIRSVMG